MSVHFLHWAAYYGRLSIVRKLMIIGGVGIDQG
jgi:hypothetical protein